METKLTIFTPTYNRKHLLPNLYNSLKTQTNKNFVWLVIDDGSSDGTEELFNAWKEESNGFEINYVRKENGGKHTAIELSNKLCQTEYIVCMDSDDYFTPDAVGKMYEEIEVIDKDDSVCGIVTRRVKPDGKPFMENWTGEKFKIIKFYDLANKYGYTTDTCLIFKTKIIKNYHFPIFENERFVTESVFYNQFMCDYDMLASDDLYYVAEYMADGYTSQGQKLFEKNPKGYAYALKQNAYCAIKQKMTLRQKVGYSALYYAWLKYAKLKKFKVKEFNLGVYGFVGCILKFIPYKTFKKRK